MFLTTILKFFSARLDKISTMNNIPTTSTSLVEVNDVITHFEMLRRYLDLDHKFGLACRQLKMLNSSLAELEDRYDRAFRDNLRSFRYSLGLRMTTLEGVKNMYYEYAERCVARMEDMQVTLEGLGLLPDSDDVSLSDSFSEDSDLSADEVDWQSD